MACHNCKTVTTDVNGKQVWVCETCGEENPPVVIDQTAQAAIDAAAAATTAPTAPPITPPVPPAPGTTI